MQDFGLTPLSDTEMFNTDGGCPICEGLYDFIRGVWDGMTGQRRP